MLKFNKINTGMLAAMFIAGMLITTPSAHARSTYVSPWLDLYPESQSYNNADCMLCHTTNDGKSGLNPYGADMDNVLPGSPSNTEITNALIFIEGDDSDSDPTGSVNFDEIDASTQPGWAEGDNPSGVIGDLDPVTPVADISVSPLSVDFGAVTVGASGADSVAISNVGTADLTVNSLSLSGSNEFSLPDAPSTSFTVAANTSVNVNVEYAPLNDGLDNGTLAIASDSPDEELITVALSGTGVPVQVNECVPVVDPASLQFGNVELGNTASLTTTVTNNGTLECAVEATVSGSIEFIFDDVSFTIDPGDSADVSVDYAPEDLGDDAGNLALEFLFPDRIINVPLSGSGIEAPVEVVDLDIKSFRVTGKTSLTKGQGIITIKLSVQNGGVVEGSAPATITGVQDGGLVYEQTQSVTDGVGGGSSKYAFEFTPDAIGEILWTVVIADGDPDDDVATDTTTVKP